MNKSIHLNWEIMKLNFLDDVSSITNSINKVVDTSNDTLMANRITGVINLLNASLRYAKRYCTASRCKSDII